ncbi:MAG: hypothetical protein OXB98_08305 [Bryobacterales bacterium]|nr:hypothetical protein [Bryobacterales bacterium]
MRIRCGKERARVALQWKGKAVRPLTARERTLSSSFLALCVLFVLSPAQTAGAPPENVRRPADDSIAGQAQEQGATILYFPDYVDGGGWSVQLDLSNVDPDAAAAVRVEVYDPDAQPVLDLFDSDMTLEIPSLGSRVLKSAGSGAIRQGWIQVEAESATVSGLLTFRHAESGIEVGVEPVQLGTEFALFVEESTRVGAGVAVFKPDAASRLELRIRDEEGRDPLDGGFVHWRDFHQAARTLPEWFAVEGVDTGFLGNFRGLLILRSEDDTPFAPLGLRFGKRIPSLSAVPTIRVLDGGPLDAGHPPPPMVTWSSTSAVTCPITVTAADRQSALTGCDPVDPVFEESAASIRIVAGGGQRAFTEHTLEMPLVARVLDTSGQSVSGVTVTFVPTPGSGRVDPSTAATDWKGEVAVEWTMGSEAGIQTLMIAVDLAVTSVNAYAIDLEAELDNIFAPPTAAEIEAVRADWAGRDISPVDVLVEFTEAYPLDDTPATLRVVSHQVGEARHYGAILAPDSAAPGTLPVLMYLHGGDSGVDVAYVDIIGHFLGELRDRFVYVVPSFRSERLEFGDRVWFSTGPGSHWDYDVDDALALLNVALELTPQAKPEGVSLIGGSRGAGVAMLAGIRDERIENIIAFFGPTDFFDDWVRQIVREAALGRPRKLTGVAHLNSTFVQPYLRGEIEMAAVRLELVRRSSVLFAEDLPAVQLHHGDSDDTVAVTQAYSMIRAMEALGREPPEFEAFIYEGGGHDVFALTGAIARALGFLGRDGTYISDFTSSVHSSGTTLGPPAHMPAASYRLPPFD